VIEFLAMAFFLAQPTAATPTATDGGTRPPMLGNVALNNPVEISAKLITGERSSATFTGDVQVKHRTLDLKCDKMVAHYTEAREVTRVVCTGGVQAQDGDRFARGERAEYDVPSGVLVVTGSPEARQGTTYVTGTKVRLTLGSERLEVENARIVVETAPAAGGGKKGKGGAKNP
jgi:lipopolysaccharide export system protein LptA